MDSSGEKRMVTLQRNPLLIETVMNCVFEYLPLEDLKTCRVVCQEWNSVSIQILDKNSKIKLDSIERMTNFLEFYKAYDTQALTFTTLHLKFSHANWKTEEYEQLTDLFNQLRENMITLIFESVNVRGELHLTPLINIATNLVGLTLISSHNYIIELDQLVKVKYLSLTGCCVNLDSFESRIAPLRISLMSVTFQRNENALREVIINDYINFSRCSEIEIIDSEDVDMIFDMSRDVFSAGKFRLERIRVINWEAKPAKMNKRLLLSEKYTGIGLKQLFLSGSELSFSVLPKSLEKLSLHMNTYGSYYNCVPFDLPNLKYLFFGSAINPSTDEMSPTAHDMGIITSMFRLCPKLVDMELWGMVSRDWHCNINVALLPVTLKRIKLTWHENINVVGDTIFHVDSLILNTGNFANAQKFMNKIKPKIVVVHLRRGGVEDPAGEIVSLVQESQNLEKVVIKISDFGSHLALRSYKTALSTYIDDDDTESKCYAFTNQVGKSLTKEEFKMYWF